MNGAAMGQFFFGVKLGGSQGDFARHEAWLDYQWFRGLPGFLRDWCVSGLLDQWLEGLPEGFCRVAARGQE